MAVLKNRAKMSTSTTGTGTITLGSVEDGYQTFADAGVANADVVRYVIEDGSNFEIGTGTYTSSGTTLSRTVSESSNSNNAINLSGSATVFIGATAEDIPETNLYAENYDGISTKPVASGTNAVSIGRNAEATASNSIALGFDAVASASLSFAALDGTATGVGSIAIGEAAVAGTSSSSIAIGRNTDATGTDAMALGSNAQSTGSESVSIAQSLASGNGSFAAVIDNNTSSYGSSGANSIAIGQLAYSGGSGAVSLGTSSLANGIQSHAFGGTSSGAYSLALGGTASGTVAVSLKGGTASGERSLAVGFRSSATKYGQKAFASGRFAADGDAQGSIFILRAATTDATATALTADQGAAGSTNQIVAASDTCIMFSGTLVAMQNGAQDQGGWEIKGLLKNDGGTTTLVSSNIQTFDDGNGWTVALSADNTNNALAITCTGEAAHNIRWVANIQTSEVTYA